MTLLIRVSNVDSARAAEIVHDVSNKVENINTDRTLANDIFLTKMEFTCKEEEVDVPEPKEESTFSRYMNSAKN